MLNIKIICVGKLKEKFYIDAAGEYIKRLSGYCKLDVLEIPEHRVPSGGGTGVPSRSGISVPSCNGVSVPPRSGISVPSCNGVSVPACSGKDAHTPARDARPTDMQSGDKAPNPQIMIALEKERSAIAGKIPAGATTVALCIEGQEMDSYGLSQFISDCALRGISRLCFIVGGSIGLHEDIKNTAVMRLSMSKMTFPHNLARVMLLEQLYRAFKITEGGKYHK